jgi:hypothetical protein
MQNNYYINTYNFYITGTNFGLLNQYKKINYINGYYFLNFLNQDFEYVENIHGGNIQEKFEEEEIKNLTHLTLWLDASDSSAYSLSSNFSDSTILLSLSDKSMHKHIFLKNNTNSEVLTAIWPVEKNYSFTSKEIVEGNFNYYKDFLKCIKFGYNDLISCSSFNINLKSPFSFYLVWKNNIVFNDQIFNKSIPFSFTTFTDAVTSELVPYINVKSVPNLVLGVRDNDDDYLYGFKVNYLSSYNVDLSKPNILELTYDGTLVQDVSTQKIFYNGLQSLSSDGNFIVNDIFGKEYISSIGYSGDDSVNDFYFCELLTFNSILSIEEREKLLNTLFNKWSIKSGYDNTTFSSGITGDSITNNTYEDFSLLSSNYEIPVQSCLTLLTINLTGYDETVSEIKKIDYEYKNKINTLYTNLESNDLNGKVNLLKNKIINIILQPSDEQYIESFNIALSVYKLDETINRITLNSFITKCGILDLFEKTNMVDSQVGNKINSNLLVLEDNKLKQLYITQLDTTIDDIYLSGGDKVVLKSDIMVNEESLLTLIDLLDIEEEVETPKFKVPFISQPIYIEANPVLNI